MTVTPTSRAAAMAGSLVTALLLATALLTATTAHAEEPIELRWDMLVPEAEQTTSARILEAIREFYGTDENEYGLGGVVPHGMNPMLDETEVSFVDDYNKKTVQMPGYVVPLDYMEEGTKTFLLVPFIGACIHVPPPPPNQIVLVESAEPYPLKEFFEAVTVTGVFDR
ncbi:MAG: DUF3299 domain-containing protein, partial [Pseudomonadota bacterium]